MVDRLNPVNWDKILLNPQPNWYSKNCPVIKVTVLDELGQTIEVKLARVSPVTEQINRFPPYGQVKESQVVILDYEIGSDGVNSSTSGIEVTTLKAGGWQNDMSKQKHILEFQGFTTDKNYKNKKWSNTI